MSIQATDTMVELAARRIMADALARALADPVSAPAETRPSASPQAIHAAWDMLSSECGLLEDAQLAPGEVQPTQIDADTLLRWLNLPTQRREQAYRQAFGLVAAKACPPHETEYLPWKDVTHQAQHIADIAGFYNAFGLRPDPSRPQRHDHVALELEFVAYMLEKTALAGDDPEKVETCRQALAMYVSDHLAWWVPSFACLLSRRVKQLRQASVAADELTLLEGVGRLLRAWIALERHVMQLPIPMRLVRAATHPGKRRGAGQRLTDCTGIVLAGGFSTRFGRDKADAVWRGETLLGRVTQRLREICPGVIAVARPEQDTRDWPVDRIVRDDNALPAGPLRGIVAGLTACPTPYAFVVSCDAPLVAPALLAHLRGLATQECAAVVPRWDDRAQPLVALYARACLPALQALLERGVASPMDALAQLAHITPAEEDCRLFDRHGASFQNINTAEDLLALNALMTVDSGDDGDDDDGCGFACASGVS